MKNVIYRRKTCRACNNNDLELYFQLKPTPIGDAYITYDQINIIQDYLLSDYLKSIFELL